MIDASIIRKAAESIRKSTEAQKIILFGSYANGVADEESDLDFFVVADVAESEIRQAERKARKSVRQIILKHGIGVDILIDSADRIAHRIETVQDSFYRDIFSEGKVIYAQ